MKQAKLYNPIRRFVLWVKRHSYLSLLALIIGGGLFLNLLLSSITPPQKISHPETSSTKLMKQIKPGEKLSAKLKDQLPITRVDKKQGTTLFNLRSDFSAKDNLVIVNQDDEVIFTKTHFVYNPNHLVKQYVDEYGEPDLVLEAPQISDAVEAHVFLNDGLLVIAHKQDGSVEQVWRFKPTSRELFLASWGKELRPRGTLPQSELLGG